VVIQKAEASEALSPSEGKRVRLRAADGCELGAIFYSALRPRPRRRVAVLHCGGGIPAVRYRRFAHFLSEFGIPVLAYDYRGIGLSRPRQLRGFVASTEDWMEYDSAAAIAWVRERFPDDEIIGISHSIGVLALGGAPNAAEQDRLILIAPHTGYFGDYSASYRLPMAMLWHGIMPVLTRMFGYFPGRRLKLGDDLPAGFALQWAGRLSPQISPVGTALHRERMRKLLANCATLERPALLVTISDDAFATAAGAQRILSYLPRLDSRRIVFTPAEANTSRLGHFGFFRQQGGPPLWSRLLASLDPPAGSAGLDSLRLAT
jgi:predicted alpha/beta hydrolase